MDLEDLGGGRTTIQVIRYVGSEQQQESCRQLAVWCLKGAALPDVQEEADRAYQAWEQSAIAEDRWKCETLYLIAKAHGGQAEWGIERMEKALMADATDDLAKINLGVALRLGGRADWKAPINEVMASSADPYARMVAVRALEAGA